jgi:hypothetical protein
MNSDLQRIWKVAVMVYFKVLPSVSQAVNEENFEKPQLGCLLPRPNFELGTPEQVKSRSPINIYRMLTKLFKIQE